MKFDTQKSWRIGCWWALIPLFVASFASNLSANEGLFLSGYDTVQLQRASGGVASPRNASWMVLNPASTVELGRRLDLNFYTIRTDVDIEVKGVLGNRGGKLGDKQWFFVPSGGLLWPTDHGTFGAGVYALSGSGVDYPQSRTWFSRYLQGNTDRRLAYQHIRQVTSYAYQFDNGWAIGAALHLSLSRLRTDHLTLRLLPAKADFDWDNALGVGAGFGVYKRWPKWSFGAGFWTKNYVEEFDAYDDLLRHPVNLPRMAQIGVAYRPIDRLELNLDYKWIGWGGLKTTGGRPLDAGFNWENQNVLKAGIEFQATDRLTVRAGYHISDDPIDKDHVFLSGLLPTTVEHQASVGLSYELADRHSLHIAYIRSFPHDITSTGRGDPFAVLTGETRVNSAGHGFSIGYGWEF